MASIFEPGVFSAPAGADLSAKLGHFVKMSSGNVVLCDAAGELAVGVLANAPASGQPAEVHVGRATKVRASTNLAVGALIKTDTAGKAAAAVTGVTKTDDGGSATDALLGSYVMGQLLEASSADGDLVTALIFPMGSVPTTAS